MQCAEFADEHANRVRRTQAPDYVYRTTGRLVITAQVANGTHRSGPPPATAKNGHERSLAAGALRTIGCRLSLSYRSFADKRRTGCDQLQLSGPHPDAVVRLCQAPAFARQGALARSAAIGRACRKEHLQRFTAAQSVKGDRSRLAETPAPHADSDTPYAIAF